MILKFIRTKLPTGIDWVVPVAMALLFFMILLPRALPFPSTFLTYDEMTIGRWISQMTQAALEGDWQGTANNYPAVTLMWTEAIEVKASQWLPEQFLIPTKALSDVDEAIFSSIPRRRLTLALVNTVIVFVTFWLLRRVYNNFVAGTATILMALDPFLLTQSRVFRTEGLNTGLMLLSLLTIFLYAKEQRRGWLIASAVLGGLAILTKITSLYLLPFTGLTLLVWPLLKGEREIFPILKSTIRDVFGWTLIMIGVFIALWPVLWVSPVNVFKDMIDIMIFSAEDAGATWGSEKQFFFLGEIMTGDPGFLFYLWSLAYRTTPIVCIGLISTLVSGMILLIHRWQKSQSSELLREFAVFSQPTLLLLAYVFFYVVAMNLGASKVDRYILPVFPGLSILAAVGFLPMATLLSYRFKMGRLTNWAVWGVVLLGSAWLALPHHPYYFSYWNPMFGGGTSAAKILPVGSGEGLDVMMEYLNGLPNAEEINLSGDSDVFYNNCRLAFSGNCFDESAFLTSDYFITYFFAVQRETIKLSTIETVRSEGELVRKFTRGGIDYAELYKLPKNLHPIKQWLGTHGRLWGYQLSAVEIGAGDSLEVTIYWENGEEHGWQLDDSEFFVKVLDNTGQVIVTAPAKLKRNFQIFQSQPGEMLLFTAPVNLPPDIQLGQYRLEIGLRLKTTGEETWNFPLPAPGDTITVNRGMLTASAEEMPVKYRLEQSVGDTGLVLLGYDVGLDRALSYLNLSWQVAQPQTEEYHLTITLLDGQDQTVTTWSSLLAPQIHPLTTWQSGEIVNTSFPLVVSNSLPADNYHLALSLWPADPAATLPVGSLTLPRLPENFALVPPETEMQHQFEHVTFGQNLDLLGYDLEGQQYSSQGMLFVTLYWLNRQLLQAAEVEVQVLDENQNVIARQLSPVPTRWQGLNSFEFALASPPASLVIKARPQGSVQWYSVLTSGEGQREQVVIERVLQEIKPRYTD